MKRFRQFIQEARRNPDQNPKISAVEYLRKWKDDSDVYISFTEIDKIGINPKSKYNTPLGIYTYPLKEIWEMYHVEARGSLKSLPFAANEPHIFVLKVNHSKGKFINDMYSDYGSDKYDKDIETLKNLFLNFDSIKKQRERLFNQQYTLKKTFKPDKKEVEAEIDEELEKKFNFMVGSALSTRKDQNAIMGFWKLTKDLSMFLGKQNAGGSDPVKWNWILRQCGYIGFGDKTGKGYIHPAEPTQAVFLQKDAFTIIGETLNKDYGKNGNAYSEYGVESIEYTGSPLPWEIDNALGDWFFKATAKGIKLSIDCTNENSLLFTAGSIADVTITSGQFNSVGLTKCKISNTSDPNMSFTECKILDSQLYESRAMYVGCEIRDTTIGFLEVARNCKVFKSTVLTKEVTFTGSIFKYSKIVNGKYSNTAFDSATEILGGTFKNCNFDGNSIFKNIKDVKFEGFNVFNKCGFYSEKFKLNLPMDGLTIEQVLANEAKSDTLEAYMVRGSFA